METRLRNTSQCHFVEVLDERAPLQAVMSVDSVMNAREYGREMSRIAWGHVCRHWSYPAGFLVSCETSRNMTLSVGWLCSLFGVCVSLTDSDLKIRSYKETYGWLVITSHRNGLVILLHI